MEHNDLKIHVIIDPTARQFLRLGHFWTRNEGDIEDDEDKKRKDAISRFISRKDPMSIICAPGR